MVRLEQLLYCIEVANCKTMSQASKKLFMTQPSLSTAIQNLEEELGFQIFKRSSHGVTLTDKGTILLEKAQIIVEQVEDIKNLSVNDDEIIRHVTIAAVPAACSAIIAGLIREIRREDERINLDVLELRPDKILSRLIEGQADIAIGSYSDYLKGTVFNEAAKYNIIIEPIYADPMYAFLGRNHPKARQASVTMAELQDGIQAFFNDRALMEANETSPKSSELHKSCYSFSDKGSIKKVVAAGLAYAIMPASMAYEDIYIDSGLIKALPITDADAALTIYIAYKNSTHLALEIDLTVELIRRQYHKLQEKMSADTYQGARTAINNKLLIY